MKMKNYLKTNENGNTTYQILWDYATVLREKFKAVNRYIKILERSLVNNLTLYFEKLEKKNKLSLK